MTAKTTENDRKRPRKWVIQLEVEERNGIKRNDFPRIFRENSTKFHEILRISLFFPRLFNKIPQIFNKIPYICIGLTK